MKDIKEARKQTHKSDSSSSQIDLNFGNIIKVVNEYLYQIYLGKDDIGNLVALTVDCQVDTNQNVDIVINEIEQTLICEGFTLATKYKEFPKIESVLEKYININVLISFLKKCYPNLGLVYLRDNKQEDSLKNESESEELCFGKVVQDKFEPDCVMVYLGKNTDNLHTFLHLDIFECDVDAAVKNIDLLFRNTRTCFTILTKSELSDIVHVSGHCVDIMLLVKYLRDYHSELDLLFLRDNKDMLNTMIKEQEDSPEMVLYNCLMVERGSQKTTIVAGDDVKIIMKSEREFYGKIKCIRPDCIEVIDTAGWWNTCTFNEIKFISKE